jgi:hypothetical protein
MTFTHTFPRQKVDVSHLDPDLLQPRPKITLSWKVGYRTLLLARALEEWRRLIHSPEFLRDVNQNWLDFDRFIEDVGLPTRHHECLIKSDHYVKYAPYSVVWT